MNKFLSWKYLDSWKKTLTIVIFPIRLRTRENFITVQLQSLAHHWTPLSYGTLSPPQVWHFSILRTDGSLWTISIDNPRERLPVPRNWATEQEGACQQQEWGPDGREPLATDPESREYQPGRAEINLSPVLTATPPQDCPGRLKAPKGSFCKSSLY